MKLPGLESPSAAVTLNDDTCVTSLSAGIEGIAGFARDKIIGESIARMLADKTVFQLPRILDTVRAAGMWEGEVSFRDGNDMPVPARGTILPLSAGENGNSGYLLLVKPIAAEPESDASDSISAGVGFHIRELVHEMNNSLAVIMGSTQLLSMNSTPSGKTQPDIEKIYSEIARMARVVESLHEYAHSLCESAEAVPVERTATRF